MRRDQWNYCELPKKVNAKILRKFADIFENKCSNKRAALLMEDICLSLVYHLNPRWVFHTRDGSEPVKQSSNGVR